MDATVLVQSERVEIRCPGDEEFAAIVSGDRVGRSWAADYPTEGDIFMATLRGPVALDPREPWGPMQIVDRASRLVVGGIGFLSAPADEAVEIGYGLAVSARGRGLATEAVCLMCSVASSHGVATMTARTDSGNLPSQAVLRRTGFQRNPQADADGEIGWARLLTPTD